MNIAAFIKRISLALTLCLATLSAVAQTSGTVESFVINQKVFNFTLPNGYCKVGGSAREREYMQAMNTFTGNEFLNVYHAVDCEELVGFLRSNKPDFDHYVLIQTVIHKGEPVAFNQSRKEFIDVNSKGIRDVRMNDIENELNGKDVERGVLLNESEIKLIGTDENGLYTLLTTRVRSPVGEKKIAAVSGASLVRSQVIMVHVYQPVDSSRKKKHMLDLAKHIVNSVVKHSK